jgi:hypothetical protein
METVDLTVIGAGMPFSLPLPRRDQTLTDQAGVASRPSRPISRSTRPAR